MPFSIAMPFCFSADLGDDTGDSEKGGEDDSAGSANWGIARITPCIRPTANFFLVEGLGSKLLKETTLLLFGRDVSFENLCRRGVGSSSRFLDILYESKESSSPNVLLSAFPCFLGQWRRIFKRLAALFTEPLLSSAKLISVAGSR